MNQKLNNMLYQSAPNIMTSEIHCHSALYIETDFMLSEPELVYLSIKAMSKFLSHMTMFHL